jgi:D-alanine-D-alanine ligase
MKKVVFLYNLNHGKFDYEAEFDSKESVSRIVSVLSKEFKVKKIEAVRDFSWIQKLVKYNPDLVFNVSEGYYGPARESVYAAIFEQLGLNYSGPDSTNMLICHNKFLSKKLLSEVVNVPQGYSVSCLDDVMDKEIIFPAIVKLNSEGSGIGIGDKSVVYNKDELIKRCQYLFDYYSKGVIVERFIAGQDYSMAYIEGLGALGPCKIEYRNDSNMYDFSMKTNRDSEVSIKPVKESQQLLKKMVDKTVEVLDLQGYAKFDFRKSTQDGKFYLIEVNAQVSMHPKGELIVAANNDGVSFEQVVLHIANLSLNRNRGINSIGFRGIV